ncbi:MAG: glycosyltransferase [Flavobacteriales bacterium]|nr:glycosyltransferase [Flavobacteriales bacterium]
MKRVLIIAYYWPPSAGSGVQRWLKFSKYLPQNGWQPVIYTPKNPDFSLKDEGLLKEVPPEAEVIKTEIWEPYQLGRKLFKRRKESSNSTGIVSDKKGGIKGYFSNWIRGNVFIPDPKVYWRKPSVDFLLDYLEKNPVDVIISTGTPHSMHLIALDLKEKLGIPWIADFRDPWSELDMLKSYHILPLLMKRYKSLERKVLEASDLSLTTSRVWADRFKELGAKNVEVITNGYDESDFQFEVKPYQQFVISHFGLLNHLRNPMNLWTALSELCEEREDFRRDFGLHLGGIIDPEILKQIQRFTHLKSSLKVFDYLSHQEVIQEYMKSSVLLLLLFNSESGVGNIPGKLFEYLAAQKNILGFGSGVGDSEQIIKETGSGYYFGYKSEHYTVKESIEKLYIASKKNAKVSKIGQGIEHYSRSKLTEKLSVLLNKI